MKDEKYSDKFNPADEQNEFERDMDDLVEWQQNQYNPGHYIGTGRIPRPVGKLKLSSGFLILIGIIFLLPVIGSLLMSDYSNTGDFLSSIISLIVPIILGVIFLYSGIQKMREK